MKVGVRVEVYVVGVGLNCEYTICLGYLGLCGLVALDWSKSWVGGFNKSNFVVDTCVGIGRDD